MENDGYYSAFLQAPAELGYNSGYKTLGPLLPHWDHSGYTSTSTTAA